MPVIESSVNAGDFAPAFALRDDEGNEHSMPAGRPAVLVFYRGRW